MAALFETMRPQTWEDVAGQDEALAQLASLRNGSGVGGRAYWLAGPSGSGKTTVARLIGSEIAGDGFCCEVDAGSLTVAEIDEWFRRARHRPLFGRGSALIINEAHGLRKDAIRKLLVELEALADHACVIFTTTKEGQATLFDEKEDSSPLVSRCVRLKWNSSKAKLRKAFAQAAHDKWNGKPLATYDGLLRACDGNFREAWQRIETDDWPREARGTDE